MWVWQCRVTSIRLTVATAIAILVAMPGAHAQKGENLREAAQSPSPI
jgi:hypothetical protein